MFNLVVHLISSSVSVFCTGQAKHMSACRQSSSPYFCPPRNAPYFSPWVDPRSVHPGLEIRPCLYILHGRWFCPHFCAGWCRRDTYGQARTATCSPCLLLFCLIFAPPPPSIQSLHSPTTDLYTAIHILPLNLYTFNWNTIPHQSIMAKCTGSVHQTLYSVQLPWKAVLSAVPLKIMLICIDKLSNISCL